jgi:hypothetical protein
MVAVQRTPEAVNVGRREICEKVLGPDLLLPYLTMVSAPWSTRLRRDAASRFRVVAALEAGRL